MKKTRKKVWLKYRVSLSSIWPGRIIRKSSVRHIDLLNINDPLTKEPELRNSFLEDV